MRVDFSWRYVVLGVYFDRHTTTWRVYPLPFVRVTRRGHARWTQ